MAAFFGNIKGYYVEVGANDPRERSQTWHLEQQGWTGVLIEPQPDLAATLRAERKGKVFAVACSSPAKAGQELPLHVAGPLSSLDRRSMAPGAAPKKSSACPSAPSTAFSKRRQPRCFDFLSIDVEGHEIEVLQGFDLARWRPRLIMIEDHVADLSKHRYLNAAGYRIIRRYENNGWYVPRDSAVAAVGPIAGKSCANIIWRCRFECCAIFRGRCASLSGTSLAPDRLAFRRLPTLRLLVALRVTVKSALEISQGDDKAGPAVDETELEHIVLQERPDAVTEGASHRNPLVRELGPPRVE